MKTPKRRLKCDSTRNFLHVRSQGNSEPKIAHIVLTFDAQQKLESKQRFLRFREDVIVSEVHFFAKQKPIHAFCSLLFFSEITTPFSTIVQTSANFLNCLGLVDIRQFEGTCDKMKSDAHGD